MALMEIQYLCRRKVAQWKSWVRGNVVLNSGMLFQYLTRLQNDLLQNHWN